MARSLPAPQRVAGTLHDLSRAARRHARRRVRRTVHAVCPPAAVGAYLASHPVARLNVGVGGALLDGWMNTDRDPGPGAVYLDVTRRFPLPDASVQRVLVEHVIEHVPLEAGRHMLRECSRVLVPGGWVRVSTPDLERIAALRTGGADPAAHRYGAWAAKAFWDDQCANPALVVNNAFRNWGHAFLYDEETLCTALAAAGFVDIRRLPYAETQDEHFADAEGAGIDEQRALHARVRDARPRGATRLGKWSPPQIRRVADDRREEAERVHGFHARFCPVARSLEGAIDVRTELELA